MYAVVLVWHVHVYVACHLCQELAHFLNRVFPPDDRLKDLTQGQKLYEFFDCSQSMSRLLGGKPRSSDALRNPWGTQLPTLISGAKIIMREAIAGTTHVSVRALEGFELMQCIGWDCSEYRRVSSNDAHEADVLEGGLLTSFAGNAFSAFACGPFSMVALACLGKANVRCDQGHASTCQAGDSVAAASEALPEGSGSSSSSDSSGSD